MMRMKSWRMNDGIFSNASIAFEGSAFFCFSTSELSATCFVFSAQALIFFAQVLRLVDGLVLWP